MPQPHCCLVCSRLMSDHLAASICTSTGYVSNNIPCCCSSSRILRHSNMHALILHQQACCGIAQFSMLKGTKLQAEYRPGKMRNTSVSDAVAEGEVQTLQLGEARHSCYALITHLSTHCHVQPCQMTIFPQSSNPCTQHTTHSER